MFDKSPSATPNHKNSLFLPRTATSAALFDDLNSPIEFDKSVENHDWSTKINICSRSAQIAILPTGKFHQYTYKVEGKEERQKFSPVD